MVPHSVTSAKAGNPIRVTGLTASLTPVSDTSEKGTPGGAPPGVPLATRLRRAGHVRSVVKSLRAGFCGRCDGGYRFVLRAGLAERGSTRAMLGAWLVFRRRGRILDDAADRSHLVPRSCTPIVRVQPLPTPTVGSRPGLL